MTGAWLEGRLVGVEECPTCHHMSIAVGEVTSMTANGVNGPYTVRRVCEVCHPEFAEEDSCG